MRVDRRVLGLALLVFLGLSHGRCGGSSAASGNRAAVVTSASVPIGVNATEFVLTGGDFTQVAGASVTVRLRASEGTPFQGGTSAVVDVPGTILSATEILCEVPPAQVCGGETVEAYVEVLLNSGVVATSAAPVVVFTAPTLARFNGSAGPVDVPSTTLQDHAVPEPFTITGTGFGPVAGTATVSFGDPAGAGTAFNGGPSIDVQGTIVSDTTITGTLPTIEAPRLVHDALADVTVTLPGGRCGRAEGLASFVAPPTIAAVTNNRAPFDQANVDVPKQQTFLACVPTDTDIDGTAFDPAVAHLFFDATAGPGTPIGAGTLGSPVVGATNISGTSPVDTTLTANTLALVRVTNPDQQFHVAPVVYSVRDVLPNVNATQQPGINSENVVVVNPTDPGNAAVFAHADLNGIARFYEMTLSYTKDHGASWDITMIDESVDGFPAASQRFDPAAAYDRFGNLYVCYGVVGGGFSSVVLVQSSDGGATFGNLRVLGQNPSFFWVHDRWTLATGLEPVSGEEAIYAAWAYFAVRPVPLVVNGCISTGLGNLSQPHSPPSNLVVFSDVGVLGSAWQNAYPEVGPNGELYVSFFSIRDIAGWVPGVVYFDADLDGLWGGAHGFGVDRFVANSNIGWKTYIPPQPERGYGTNAQIVCVRAGPHTGRLLICHTDEDPDDQTPQGTTNPTPNSNTLVVVRISDDQGATWADAIPVHTDTPEHQFMHWLHSDRATGELYVSFFDCRNDPGNTLTQRMSASSLDGVTWTPELLLAQGRSDATGGWGSDYLEYCGTAAHDGCVYACWTDFSNYTGDNPDGTVRGDVYVSVYMQR